MALMQPADVGGPPRPPQSSPAPQPPGAATNPWSYQYQGPGWQNTPSPIGQAGVPNLSQLLSGQAPPGTDPSVAGLWSGIGGYELGPAYQNLGAQTGLVQTQGDITQQQLADQAAQLRQESGFSLGQLGIQGSNLGLQRQALLAQAGPGGFQEQQRGLTAAEQAYQLGQSQRSLRSGATASGSINTAGTQQSWSDLLANYGFQKSQAGLQAKEQQQQFQTSMKQLDNAARSLGISQQEVESRLTNSIAQLGLQGRLDALGVAQAVQQLQSGFLSGPWAQAIQQVLQGAGLPINTMLGGG